VEAGKKRLITIRQLLTMTSGLQNTGRGDEVYDAPDSVKRKRRLFPTLSVLI
jgi:CubicO group peptidase (beta-lactamase class C family)